MARNYGKFYLSAWGDPDFRSLTSNAQRMYMFLVSQPDLTCVGTIPIRIGRWAGCASDLTPEDVRANLAELAVRRLVVVDEQMEELLIRSFVRYDDGWKSPNVMKGIVSTARTVMSESIRATLRDEIKRIDTSDLPTKINEKTNRSTRDFIESLIAGLVTDLASCEVSREVANWAPETLPERVPETLPERVPENGLKTSSGNPSRKGSRKGSPTANGQRPIANSQLPTANSQHIPEFSDFYAIYPRKMKRVDAQKAWGSAIKRADPETILAGARRYAADPNLPGKEFIPYPATWLRAGSWDDEPLPPRPEHRQTNGLSDAQWQRAYERADAYDREHEQPGTIIEGVWESA